MLSRRFRPSATIDVNSEKEMWGRPGTEVTPGVGLYVHSFDEYLVLR